ncbi:protein kinase [Roseiconus nitratireducens]|uniref:Protein kinase n=1 Tax=Roseiconus nitratireducens TaxID=2605748 RepID=A0A5M6D8M2_9BACT|nr:protein kinase [Roseiconus nitratireducens]KAA5543867.1 protein kinase [Roseiconus nitratireducens]
MADHSNPQGDSDSATVDFDWTPQVAPIANRSSGPPSSKPKTKPADTVDVSHPVFAAGRCIGDYEIVREIGRGGMGVVFQATQRSLNRRVALKVLPFSGAFDHRALVRFQNEAWAAAQLDHRHIVPVQQVGEENGIHYYVMPYIPGGDLAHVIKMLKEAAESGEHPPATNVEGHTTQKKSGRDKESGFPGHSSTRTSGISKKDTLASHELLRRVAQRGTTSHPKFIESFVKLGIQVAEGLHYAHEVGIVHRDIKPSNLLLDLDGDAHIADFGLAQFGDDRGATITGALVGTYCYMSPEQAIGKNRAGVDQRSDIFSLGATLYELLTLRRAFSGETREDTLRKVMLENPMSPRRLDPHIPAALETILMTAMAKNPDDRYQTAAELAEDLALFRDHRPIKAQQPTLSQRLIQWGRANRHLAAAAASSAFVALIGSIVIAAIGWSAWSTTSNALQSEQKERQHVESLLRFSDSQRLAKEAALYMQTDPALALRLALISAEKHPGADANNMILAALAALHEQQTLQCDMEVGHVAFNGDGTRLLVTARQEDFDGPPRGAQLWDVAQGRRIHEFMDDRTTGPITSAMYSPDNARILTTASPPAAQSQDDIDGQHTSRPPRLWEDVAFRPLVIFEDAFLFETHPALFDHDGRRVVLPTMGNSATVFDCVGGQSLLTLTGHQERVVFTAFVPAGDRIVTASDDNTVRVWDAKTGESLFVFDLWKQKTTDDTRCVIDSISIRPDGKHLATGSQQFGVHLWDLTEGVRIPTDHLTGTHCAYLPDNLHLAVWNRYGNHVQVLLGSNAQPRREFQASGPIVNATLSPDASWLSLRLLGPNRINLWSTHQPHPSASLPGHQADINSYCFDPSSQILATGSNDGTVKLWHIQNGRQRATFSDKVEERYTAAVVDPQENHVAYPIIGDFFTGTVFEPGQEQPIASVTGTVNMPVGSSTRFVKIDGNRLAVHDIDSGEPLKSISSLFGPYQLAAINGSGDRVAADAGDGAVTLWFPDQDRRLALETGEAAVLALEFSPDGNRVVAASEDGVVRVWDADSGEELAKLAHDARVTETAFSPGAKWLAAVTDQSRAVVWDFQTYEKKVEIGAPGTPLSDVKFNFDGTRVISFDRVECREVVAWDIETGDAVGRIAVPGRCDVTSHPANNEVLICSNEQGAAIWLYDENRRLPLTGDPRVYGAYTPDGTRFFTCSEIPWGKPLPAGEVLDYVPCVLQRWSRESLQPDWEIQLPFGTPRGMVLSGDGKVLLNAFHQHGLEIRDVATTKLHQRLYGHLAPITSIHFAEGGQTLISAGRDGRARVWRVSDGSLQRTFNEHQRPIEQSALLDQQRLLTADDKGKCVLQSLATGEVLQRFSMGDQPLKQLDLDVSHRFVIAVSRTNTLHCYDLEAAQAISLPLNDPQVAWAEFSPNQSRLLVIPAAARRDSAPDGKSDRGGQEPDNTPEKNPYHVLIAPLEGDQAVDQFQFASPVKTSHFLPDGKGIVTLTGDGTITMTDLASGDTLNTIKLPDGEPFAAVVDPSGDWLAAHHGNSMSIWRLEDNREWYHVDTGALPLPDPPPADPRDAMILDRFDPFVSNHFDRILVAKSKTLFTLPLHPENEGGLATRELTPKEEKQFLLEAPE